MVKLIEVLTTNSKIYIVLELISGGDLFEKIKLAKVPPLSNMSPINNYVSIDILRKKFERAIYRV